MIFICTSLETRFVRRFLTACLKKHRQKVVLVSSQSCSGKLGTIKHRDDDDWHKRGVERIISYVLSVKKLLAITIPRHYHCHSLVISTRKLSVAPA